MEKYKVKTGDTLERVAKKYGIAVNAIKRANNLKTDTLTVGQILIIPEEIKTFVIKINTKKPIDAIKVAEKPEASILKVIKLDACCCARPKDNFPYTANTFNKIKEIAPLVKHYASKYSVPPIAVAGSIADEYNIINESDEGKLINWLQDSIVQNFVPNFAIEFGAYIGSNAKLANTTKNDLGIGNIKLETAKALYEQYKQSFKLKNWDYNDIVDYIQSNEGTVHLAALVIRKAKEKLGEYISDFCECKKEAVLVTYYKKGDSYIEKYLKRKKTASYRKILPGEGCRVSRQRDEFLKILK